MIDVALKQLEELVSELEGGINVRKKQKDELANTWRKMGIRDG